jgi:hypothetical protein
MLFYMEAEYNFCTSKLTLWRRKCLLKLAFYLCLNFHFQEIPINVFLGRVAKYILWQNSMYLYVCRFVFNNELSRVRNLQRSQRRSSLWMSNSRRLSSRCKHRLWRRRKIVFEQMQNETWSLQEEETDPSASWRNLRWVSCWRE